MPKTSSRIATTDAALKNACRIWTSEFDARFPDELTWAYEEMNRLLADRPNDVGLDTAGSLLALWAALWRPMQSGVTGLELARGMRRFDPPVLRAAITKLSQARATLVDVLDVERPKSAEPILVARDVFDGSLYRIRATRTFADGVARWLRCFGVLVELGDGTWVTPSILFGTAWVSNVDPRALVEAVRDEVEALGWDRDDIDPAAPHLGLARWAGVAFGVLVRMLSPNEEQLREAAKKKFMVTHDRERVEPTDAALAMDPSAEGRVDEVLSEAPEFVGTPGDWSLVGGPTRVFTDGETIAVVTWEGSCWAVRALTLARCERARARLEALLGVEVRMEDVRTVRPWETDDTLTDRDGPDAELIELASAPFATQRAAEEVLERTTVDVLRDLLDQDTPSLGGRPREMVATTEGRRQVEAWLVREERKGFGAGARSRFLDLDELREDLGLPTVRETIRGAAERVALAGEEHAGAV